MKKLFLLFVSILILTGCSDKNIEAISNSDKNVEVTTYNEVIKDGKVVFGDISYDIESVFTKTLTYDKHNKIKKMTEYTDGNLYSTTHNYYNGDQLIKVIKVYENGLETISEYSYGDGFMKVSLIVSDEEMSIISTSYMDENDRLLKTDTTEDGVITSSNTYHYEEDELKQILNYREGKLQNTHNYEYNNIGDVIVRHTIYHNEDDYILVEFFDYEYHDNMLPKTITRSWIHSEREGFAIIIN